MKIAVLHGAILNVGDFLIAERSISLLKYCFPKAQINKYYRNQDLSEYLNEINSNDIMVVAGGPGYVNGFYPGLMPLCGSLDNIKIPIMIMGMGWSGLSSSPIYLYNYKYDAPMVELLKRAEKDTGTLGCRDYYTANVLRNNGFDNVVMTGCPAWYDLQYIHQINYLGPKLGDCKNICISDCANTYNLEQLTEVILFVKRFFAGANIKLVFHRGTGRLKPEFVEFVQKNKIDYIDISGSLEGIKVYDDCDLHIGYRVHAHIYNLSKRKLSILIEEDSRGSGVNSALGLERILANTDIIIDNSYKIIPNNNVVLQLEDYIFNICSNNYLNFNIAYGMMEKHFNIMENHVKSIAKYIG